MEGEVVDEVWDYLNEDVEIEDEFDIKSEVDSFEKIEESFTGHNSVDVKQITPNEKEKVVIIRDDRGEFQIEYWEIDKMIGIVNNTNNFYELKIFCKNFRFLVLIFQTENEYTKFKHTWEVLKSNSLVPLVGPRGYNERYLEDNLFMRKEIWAKEFERQKVDFEKWSLNEANNEYNLCPTYPKYLLFPKDMTEEELKGMTKFRSKGRIPATSYHYYQTSATISRCSQPLVGVFGSKRNEYDEKIIQLFGSLNKTSKQIYIMDCRSYLSALANKAKGAGTESTQYYGNCSLSYANIENIHVMRESIYQLFHFTCIYDLDESTLEYHQLIQKQLKITWFSHIQLILAKSFEISNRVKLGFSVLIHCTDGWDRTSQLSATSQLLIDPFFRTIDGFILLIEKEWLSFGHKFKDRCHQERLNMFEENEQSPVFLQWLDCVYQLTQYFPSSFEFNGALLHLLADSTHSCKYRTLLFNSEKERVMFDSPKPCLWQFILSQKNNYLNNNYDPNSIEYLDILSHNQIEYQDLEELKTDKISLLKVKLWDYYFRYNHGFYRTEEQLGKYRKNLEKVLEMSVELQKNAVSPMTQITEFFTSFLGKSFNTDNNNEVEVVNENGNGLSKSNNINNVNNNNNNNNVNNSNGSWGSLLSNVIPPNFKFF